MQEEFSATTIEERPRTRRNRLGICVARDSRMILAAAAYQLRQSCFSRL